MNFRVKAFVTAPLKIEIETLKILFNLTNKALLTLKVISLQYKSNMEYTWVTLETILLVSLMFCYDRKEVTLDELLPSSTIKGVFAKVFKFP